MSDNVPKNQNGSVFSNVAMILVALALVLSVTGIAAAITWMGPSDNERSSEIWVSCPQESEKFPVGEVTIRDGKEKGSLEGSVEIYENIPIRCPGSSKIAGKFEFPPN